MSNNLVRGRSPESRLPDDELRSKRRRLDIPIKNHESLYFDDGNIVLIVGPEDSDSAAKSDGTTERVAFRVHRGILTKQSSVFASMFELPHMEDMDTYDGCASVCLPDSSSHVESLLSALYNGCELLAMARDDSRITDRLEGALLLSQKYLMDSLSESIAKYLTERWPRSLAEWDRMESSNTIALERMLDAIPWPDTGPSLGDIVLDPATSIYLARAADLPHILPSAFYDLSRIDDDDFKCPPYLDKEDDVYPDLSKRSTNWTKLRHQDLMAVMRGRDRMRRHISCGGRDGHVLFDWEHQNISAMETVGEAKCIDAVRKYWSQFLEWCSHQRDPLSILGQWEKRTITQHRVGFGPALSSETCATCRARIKNETLKLRRELWHNLPAFFDIVLEDGIWDENKFLERTVSQ